MLYGYELIQGRPTGTRELHSTSCAIGGPGSGPRRRAIGERHVIQWRPRTFHDQELFMSIYRYSVSLIFGLIFTLLLGDMNYEIDKGGVR